MKKEFRFDELVKKIYEEMPFLGYILTSIRRRPSKDIPTAGITPKNLLLYNKDFMSKQNLSQAKFILLHEVLHHAHKHFIRADQILEARFGIKNCMIKDKIQDLPIEDQIKVMRYHNAFNITMDVAINQLCEIRFKRPNMTCLLDLYLENLSGEQKKEFENLPEEQKKEFKKIKKESQIWGLKELEKFLEKKLEKVREFEYYFHELLKCKQEELDKDPVIIPVHSVQFGEDSDSESDGQEDGSSEEKDIFSGAEEYSEEMKNIIRKAVEKQKEYEAASGIGSDSPDSLSPIMPDLSVKVNDKNLWKSLVNKAFGDIKISDQEVTIKRPSRRNPDNPFGRRRITSSQHIIVCVDTSSSITRDDVSKFFGVINRAIKRYGVTVDLLLTNTRVYRKHLDLKHLDSNNIKISPGGTDLTQAQKWILKNKKDIKSQHLIVLTDGYTDWIGKVPFSQAAIYTPEHDKLPGISDYAILEK